MRRFQFSSGETIDSKVVTWGQKILKNGQVVTGSKYRKRNEWDEGKEMS